MIATAVIADKLDIPNFTPEHVSMKFKNLRNSYCQELKKMASDENYKPKVFWFSYMDKFIKPHLQKINTYNIDKVSTKNILNLLSGVVDTFIFAALHGAAA